MNNNNTKLVNTTKKEKIFQVFRTEVEKAINTVLN